MAYALDPSSNKKRRSNVLLGFLDSEIDQSVDSVNYLCSKIGGNPNFPFLEDASDLKSEIICPVCGTSRPLICQIYAPLEDSIYHRTLYVFACLVPSCWNNASSWSCIRIQKEDESLVRSTPSTFGCTEEAPQSTSNVGWFDDQDDWGDEVEQEENGNEIEQKLENLEIQDNKQGTSPSPDLTTSEDLSSDLSIGDANANEQFKGATAVKAKVEESISAYGTAEIEADQDDVIGVETPDDLMQNSEIPQLFSGHRNNHNTVQCNQLRSYYVFVEEEQLGENVDLTDHERSLLKEYKARDGADYEMVSARKPNLNENAAGQDLYEKAVPKHGDSWFHKFNSVIQQNPGQILRYSQDSRTEPIFLSKPELNSKFPTSCKHCKSGVICELQLLPSLVSLLKPISDNQKIADPVIEFGTVMIMTCKQSCWAKQDSFRNEQIWLQAETV